MIYVLLCLILAVQFLNLFVFSRMAPLLGSLSQLSDVLGTFGAAPNNLKK